jgi:hypothetical protein
MHVSSGHELIFFFLILTKNKFGDVLRPSRRKVSGQNKNQLSFIKANTNSITDQLDTLKSVKQRYEIGG